MDSARHVSQRIVLATSSKHLPPGRPTHFEPSFSGSIDIHDVTSAIHQSLAGGDVVTRRGAEGRGNRASRCPVRGVQRPQNPAGFSR
jgi:hypothetical protein